MPSKTSREINILYGNKNLNKVILYCKCLPYLISGFAGLCLNFKFFLTAHEISLKGFEAAVN